MAAKKTAKKAAKKAAPKAVKPAAKKTEKPAAKKVARKAPAKKAAKKSTTAKPAPASRPSNDTIARAAYLNYRRRVEQGLPGDTRGDWLEAERQLGIGTQS
jgi:hypothetical protein